MADIECPHCGKKNSVPHLICERAVTLKCEQCLTHIATGREDEIREKWEKHGSQEQCPSIAEARGIALSESIWTRAKKNKIGARIGDSTKQAIRASIKKSYDLDLQPEIVFEEYVTGRRHRGLMESGSQCAAVVVIDNKIGALPYSIYVIFRGSAGSLKAIDSEGNKLGRAGWRKNVDWRANFDNEMDTADYCADKIRIHGGFKNVLESYRGITLYYLSKAKHLYPNSHVVVTGHSQGGGHAILFAHWLEYKAPQYGAACLPFSPPRVGNFAFAWDFTTRISVRDTVYAFDGVKKRAFLIYRGTDAVVLMQKHATAWDSPQHRKHTADLNILGAGLRSFRYSRNRVHETDIYFHPKTLIRLDAPRKHGLLRAIDHKPDLIRKALERSL